MAKPTAKSKKLLQKRTKLEKFLLALLLAIILFILLASHYQWWPFSSQYGGKGLGTAFYTAAAPSNESAVSSDGNTGNASGSAGNSGSNGSNGTSGSNGSNGGSSTTPPAANSAILNFSAGVNTGDSKQDISGQASGLDEHCALLVNSSTAGKQEVCTYTQGDKVVTVTYLNDQVVSASRSGF